MSDLPPGVRRNALSAPHWVELLAVDPRVTDALLLALEDAGIAAYADADSIWVDGTRRETAAEVVAAELPGMLAELEPVLDESAAFDAIVARWDAEPEAPVPPWPVNEDLGPPRPADPPTHRAIQLSLPAEDDDEPVAYDEGHFVPPPPEPIPEAQPVTRWAAISVGIGLLLLIGLPMLGTDASMGVQVVGALAVIGGVATLVWRMRDAPSVDDGPDDGAVV